MRNLSRCRVGRWVMVLLLVLLPAVNIAEAGENTLSPFTSDGCSSFPDGTLSQRKLWLKCCTAHDYAYWKGGTYKQRLEADEKLQSCVEQVGEKEIALLMLAGVRVGGTPYLPTPFRWGYGWPYPRLYRNLTEDEEKQVVKMGKSKQLFPLLSPKKMIDEQ